jgi:hypothetical protein
MKLNRKCQVMDVCAFRCSDLGFMNTSEGKKMQLTDSFRKSPTLFAAVAGSLSRYQHHLKSVLAVHRPRAVLARLRPF